MSEQSAEILVSVPPEDFYKVLIDYEQYPEFVSSVKNVEILKREDNHTQVYFELDLIKKVKYLLDMEEDSPNRLGWSLIKGDLFKVNRGAWELEEVTDSEGKRATKAIYSTEIEFSLFVPKMITKTLVAVNLPNNLKEFKNRAEKLYWKN